MKENLTCKYLPGTCYSCSRCLYCFQQGLCKCKKNKQPLRTKRPKRGQQIYQRAYTPDSSFPKANKFLFDANTKFGYDSNFEETFSYTFCSACNSKFQRLRHEDKITPQQDNELSASDISPNEKESDNNDTDGIEGDSQEEEEFSSDGNDLEEIKIQIIVKSKEIKVPTAKTLTIAPVNYINIMDKINSEVRKVLRKKTKSEDYNISYKAVNARGPPNTFEDRSDFQEFIDEYQKAFLSGKKILVTIVVKDKKKSAKKHKKVKKKNYLFIFYKITNLIFRIFFQNSDESGFSSTEEETELEPTKKRKSRATRKNDLMKDEMMRAEVINTLCAKYKCDSHTTLCYIQDNRHLQLNPARLQLWARKIV